MITCYEIIIKCKIKRNIFSFIYENDKYGERERKRKREREKEKENIKMFVLLYDDLFCMRKEPFYKLTMKGSIYPP